MVKMMKKILTVVICLFLAACGNGATGSGGDSGLTVISIGPSITEILVGLGAGDTIVAVDYHSTDISGLNDDLPFFDLMNPNAEQIIALSPDIVFVVGMALGGGDDPFQVVSDAGITVIHVPTSDSIDDIKNDIRRIAQYMDMQDTGDNMIEEMEYTIEVIREIGASIPDADRKTVYFEISSAPFMFSFGSGVFLHEMIELTGAINVFGDQQGWFSVSDEYLIVANPDVIITNVSYLDDPIGELRNRPGWDVVTAVQDGRIYQVDSNTSSRPNHRIVYGMWQIARAVYPDHF